LRMRQSSDPQSRNIASRNGPIDQEFLWPTEPSPRSKRMKSDIDRPVPCDEMPTVTHLVQIRRKLLRWGKANFREFAWRHEADGWLTLVAEILLQRTRAEQVERTFIPFSHRFPKYSDVLNADPIEIENITTHLGIHGRAAVIRELASWIADHGDECREKNLSKAWAIRSRWLTNDKQACGNRGCQCYDG